MDKQDFLTFKDINKSFSGVRVLKDVNCSIKKGDVHAIVGENGAGKSTLVKILAGVYPVGEYTGAITLEGQECWFKDIRQAEDAGICIIYQELELIPSMTVSENIYLGYEPGKRGVIDHDLMHKNAVQLLARLHADISPEVLVEQLRVGQQQIVAICRALSKNAKILIFDEPTSALSDTDVVILFDIIRGLKKEGVTSIFISHKLHRVREISDSLTILRDGRSVAGGPIEEFSEAEIITHMVGRELLKKYPRVPHQGSEVVMEVKNFTVFDPGIPKTLVDNVSFSVRKGEILGFSGLMGAGRTELFMAMFGSYDNYEITGEIYLEGEKLTISTPYDAIKKGLGLVVENRKEHGLVACLNIINNSTLANLTQLTTRLGAVDENEAIHRTKEYAEKFSLRYSSLEQLVESLSGGNQQKVVITKSLMASPKILILDEPTRGIDVLAKHDIYNIMNQLIEEGVAIVMISSEMPEIMGMADRIFVMCEGKITGELMHEEATQEKIMQFATRFKG
ncbi:MAG: sugar ABC transporter ATP-binding protein [Sphaerochaetaceae bacterium]